MQHAERRGSGAPRESPAKRASTTGPGSLRDFLSYFLRLGTFGFGGPIVLAGHMQQDLVETRHWITAEEYAQGLAFAQLSPGPLAAQLAMYLGWVRGRTLGATLVAAAFILPSFVMVLALAACYVAIGGLPWIRGAFYGIGAVVIAVIARSAWKLVRRTVGRDRLLWAILVVNAACTAWTEREIVWVFALSGVLAVLLRAPPAWLRRGTQALPAALPPWLLVGLHGAAAWPAVARILGYFAAAGVFVFGSGLAIVPFLRGGVVGHYHWLSDRQFLDAVAVAMITPGPVVITVAFIGYLVAGLAGALAAGLGVFLPSYLIVVLLAPQYRRFADNRSVRAFVGGVTAAACGAISGAAVVLGRRAITDLPTAAIFLSGLALLVALRELPEPLLILGAGIAGLAIKAAGRG